MSKCNLKGGDKLSFVVLTEDGGVLFRRQLIPRLGKLDRTVCLPRALVRVDAVTAVKFQKELIEASKASLPRSIDGKYLR